MCIRDRMLRDDLLHGRHCLLELFRRERANVAAHDRLPRDHVRLPERRAAALRRVVLHLGTSEHYTGVDGEVLLAAEACPEPIENPRCFVQRAGADVLTEDLRRVAWRSGRFEGPRPVSYTHLRAHETPEHLVCRLLLEKKKET